LIQIEDLDHIIATWSFCYHS